MLLLTIQTVERKKPVSKQAQDAQDHITAFSAARVPFSFDQGRGREHEGIFGYKVKKNKGRKGRRKENGTIWVREDT